MKIKLYDHEKLIDTIVGIIEPFVEINDGRKKILNGLKDCEMFFGVVNMLSGFAAIAYTLALYKGVGIQSFISAIPFYFLNSTILFLSYFISKHYKRKIEKEEKENRYANIDFRFCENDHTTLMGITFEGAHHINYEILVDDLPKNLERGVFKRTILTELEHKRFINDGKNYD